MSPIPILTLNNGVKIPAIGLGGGTYHPAERETAKDWFLTGLQAGYKLVDVAQIYCTEEGLGKAIKASGIPREELFITTKIPAPMAIITSCLLSEGEFYPKHPDGSIKVAKSPSFVELWAEIEKLLDTGKVRAIGVCNFSIKNLEILLKSAKVVPAVNQFELHPYLAQNELIEYCKSKGIAVEAYTPTGNKGCEDQHRAHAHLMFFIPGYQKVLSDPTITELAGKYGVSSAQLVLAWHLARGCIAIPKSSNAERQKQNLNLPTLDPSDVAKISALDKGERICAKLDENGTLFGATAEQLGW
ncbi:hypothetical protein PC9H_011790 [Pleurotus ostreatus]|uniref:NADP-dependent oxidoreductase domain-containing protein n=1 Tax=Pleurotus ostreatus TaxID=5322 RepID=A0A8H6ZMG1_PLEOS|nr:uncharacterized protein PC9H_011790 [Pleurotus ostreatus]KAF7421268.1 hypothetical protein PC9H_011790 [Pleurotus ostreatus]